MSCGRFDLSLDLIIAVETFAAQMFFEQWKQMKIAWCEVWRVQWMTKKFPTKLFVLPNYNNCLNLNGDHVEKSLKACQ